MPKNGDCNHPILVTDTMVVSKYSPEGYGNLLEISGNVANDVHFFEQEHNTVWYCFRSPCHASLSFEIIPDSINDDYDFALYRCEGDNFCENVRTKKILPVRTCISRNDKKGKSVTGLSVNAKQDLIHSGVGNSFARVIEVNKNDLYFLLVDNAYNAGGGHILRLHWKYIPPAPHKYLPGEIFEFENIIFEEGTAKFDRNSFGWLDSLRRIMVNNPNLKIEIRGHVDGYSSKNTDVYMRVSLERAKAVYEYLCQNRIDSARMVYKGFGNTRMKYVYPDFQPFLHKKNRTVEMVVLSNN